MMVFEVRRRSPASLGVSAGSSERTGARSKADGVDDADASADVETSEGSLPDGGMIARRESDAAQWRFETGGQVRGSPAVDGRSVYAGSNDGNLYVIDCSSGQVRWRLETNARRMHAPVIRDDTVYAASDNALYALDASTGTVRWRYEGRHFLTAPVVADGTVFMYTNRSNEWRLHAIDADSGTFRWTVTEDADDIDRLQTNIVVDDGVCYVGTWEVIFAFVADTGRVRWSRERPQIVESLAAVGEGLVCGGRTSTEEANLYALGATSGSEEWTATTRPGEWITAVREVNDVLYASSIEPHHDGTKTTRLHARSVADGAKRWSFVTNRETTTSVPPRPATVADGLVFVPGGRQVYALDAVDGTERARFETDGEVHTSVAVSDAGVYVGSDDGAVYGFDLTV